MVGVQSDGPGPDLPSEWQRRYDASLERQRERNAADPDAGLIELTGWAGAVPGWAGLAALVLGGVIYVGRVLLRRRRSEG